MTEDARNEDVVKLAADCYEARRAARFILGSDYAERIKPYRMAVRQAMAREGLDNAIRACIHLLNVEHNPHTMLLLLAAAVDISEDTTVKTT
jgi:hypothetical protein